MKVLVIRFSSIGDVTQSLSVPALIKQNFKQTEIHFLTKSDFSDLAKSCPSIDHLWTIDSKKGILDLFKIILKLKSENFDVIYDAHNNLRSNLVRICVNSKLKITKPMYRWKRFLLLKFKKNLFTQPHTGQWELLRPLEKLGLKAEIPQPPIIKIPSSVQQKVLASLADFNLYPKTYLIFVPSAAHALKRWPVAHWKKLIELNSHKKIIILAGPKDHFTEEFNSYPNVINLKGKTTLLESAGFIAQSEKVVTNDTGMLHFAEQLGIKTIALMGPAPFGLPSRTQTTTRILEKNLECRPCSKHGQGPCVNKHHQACLDLITPEEVQNALL